MGMVTATETIELVWWFLGALALGFLVAGRR